MICKIPTIIKIIGTINLIFLIGNLSKSLWPKSKVIEDILTKATIAPEITWIGLLKAAARAIIIS